MRLVKDNDTTFHFQWAEPLKEERIILIRYNGVRRYNAEDLFGYSPESPWEKELLVYFPAGTVVSAPVDRGVYRHDKRQRRVSERIDSVELLPARLRETVLPAELYEMRQSGYFQIRGERVILREHPFFQEYHVGAPSRLTFTLEPRD